MEISFIMFVMYCVSVLWIGLIRFLPDDWNDGSNIFVKAADFCVDVVVVTLFTTLIWWVVV